MVLDDSREIARVDTGGMVSLVQRLGPMVAEGWEAAATLRAPSGPLAAVVVCGMGGSGIGGDLLGSLLAESSPVPVLTVKADRLPAFVGRDTLVFVCSYSGNTEETLAAYDAAHHAGASIVAVTSGGTLAQRARERGDPVVTIPPGCQPRAALPYLLMPMLRVTAGVGIARISEADVKEAATLLTDLAGQWGPAARLADNPAKGLAVALRDAMPVIYAASPNMEPVAQRWKTQFNESSKILALWNTFPELTHNDVVGWERVADGPALHVVVLRDQDDGARNSLRVEAASHLAFRGARGVTEVQSVGTSRLARAFSLIMLGDFVSCYLAVLRGVDPTTVAMIDRIKERLQLS
ncbi:MAG: bifunctional phosphoglucose/phosphomannose isomerase [Armatimonadota bacterium]